MFPFTTKQWVITYAILGLIGILVVRQLFWITDNRLSVSVLDVGQGDAILIQTPEHKNILIDAGPDSSVLDGLGNKMGFFDHTIDLFILTHPHRDHVGGALDVIRKYPIRQVMLTGITMNDPFYTDFLREINNRHIPIIFPQNKEDLQIAPEWFLDILYPFDGQSLIGQTVKNANNTSIVTRLVKNDGSVSILLTGDAEQELEKEVLLSGADVKSPLLKIGHHGSRTATSDAFLAAVKPQTAVISVGKDNDFGHPHAETLEKLKAIAVRQTMTKGTITFEF